MNSEIAEPRISAEITDDGHSFSMGNGIGIPARTSYDSYSIQFTFILDPSSANSFRMIGWDDSMNGLYLSNGILTIEPYRVSSLFQLELSIRYKIVFTRYLIIF